MSGQRRDPLAAGLRAALAAASAGYRLAVQSRNRGFDRGRRDVHACGVPVLSVGNLTTGGTGKTPLVAFLASWFRSRGVRVAIVSRGYGRGDADENDEAAELYQRLPDVPHVQDPDRVEAARIAVEELESELILMDDGFQHRRLHRDLDLVLIDLTCPFGYERLLPRGLLREPIANLCRADAIVLTRCDQVDPLVIEQTIATIRRHHPQALIVRCNHRPRGLLAFPDQWRAAENLRDRPVALISGIGNPQAFRKSVADLGARVIGEQHLSDHADYSPETVLHLDRWVRTLAQAERIVCTQKDLVKLRTDRLGGRPLEALVIEAQLDASREFEALLAELEATAKAQRDV
jgi:tetraacyldisaccharide 4'-kinase